MTKNKALHKAAKAQQDEFYTQMDDIDAEFRHYYDHFRGKKILCNCDDPYESNFFKFFALKFNSLNLKKLTATCYSGSPIAQQQFSINFGDEDIPAPMRKPYCAIITDFQDYNGDTAEDLQDIRYMLTNNVGAQVYQLQGNGDFRSDECIELLKDAELVVTNPPFSLLREYIAQLIHYNKKFLIVGNFNAITYKEIFPLFMQNKMWLGKSIHSGDRKFYVPESYPLEASGCGIDEEGRRFIRVKGVRWFTNLPMTERQDFMILTDHYSPEKYPKYDNYDAIEVSKTIEIPCDYDGVMGVPITFLDKYNPEQFEILGITQRDSPLKTRIYTRDDCPNYGDMNARATIRDSNGKLRSTYVRLLVRKILDTPRPYSIIHHGSTETEETHLASDLV